MWKIAALSHYRFVVFEQKGILSLFLAEFETQPAIFITSLKYMLWLTMMWKAYS